MHAKTGAGGFASHTYTLGMDFIVNEMAGRLLGEGWQARFIDKIRNGGIEQVLL